METSWTACSDSLSGRPQSKKLGCRSDGVCATDVLCQSASVYVGCSRYMCGEGRVTTHSSQKHNAGHCWHATYRRELTDACERIEQLPTVDDLSIRMYLEYFLL
jgi:hypothetical protein